MHKQDIENIRLDHQQLLFGFEEDVRKEEDIVMSCINNQIEESGYVALDGFVEHVSKLHDLSDATIIQHVFWFAVDLKFHLLMDGQTAEPHIIRQALLASPDRSVSVIPNKSVDSAIFQDVKRLYRKLVEDEGSDDREDQYEFSRCLARKIREWIRILEPYRTMAQKPFFPFEKEIAGCLDLIGSISAKLDSFSLINAFFDKKKEILELSDEVKRISEFYSQHIYPWTNLIQSYEEIDSHLSSLRTDTAVNPSFKRLRQILLSSAPYDQMTEVKSLLDEMTRRCREILSVKIDMMIAEMRKHCDAYQASPDVRNESLYSLRAYKQNIGKAGNIRSMNRHLIGAEERFQGVLDELMM